MSRINRKEDEFPIMVPGKDFALPTGQRALELVLALETKTKYQFLPGKMQGIDIYIDYFEEIGLHWVSEKIFQYEKNPSDCMYLVEPIEIVMSFLGNGKLSKGEPLTQENIEMFKNFINMIISGLDYLDGLHKNLIESVIRSNQYEIFDMVIEKIKILGNIDISRLIIYDKYHSLFEYIKKLETSLDSDIKEKAQKLKAILKKHGYEID